MNKQGVVMAKLNEKFLKHIQEHWYCPNWHGPAKTYKALSNNSGVYIFTHINLDDKTEEIVYVGSTTQLFNRYKSHHIPEKIVSLKRFASVPRMYFIEMPTGFYDYEMKLIRKLKPLLNKLTYGR